MKPLNGWAVVAILASWGAFLLLHQNLLGWSLSAGAVLCALLRGRVAISRRFWMVSWLAVVVIASLIFRAASTRAQGSGLIYLPLLPVVVSLGVATYPALLRQHTRREYWASLVISGLLFLLCGLNLEPLAREFALLATLWTTAFSLSARAELTGRRPGLGTYLTLLPAFAVLGLMALGYAYSELQANSLLRYLSSGTGLTFPASSKLNTLQSAETNPAVVVRVFSRQPNTYLPARIYTTYEGGAWTSKEVSQPVMGQPVGQDYHYQLGLEHAGTPKLERLEIHNSPSVIMAPRDASWVELNKPKLYLLSGHLMEVRGGGNELQTYTVARYPEKELAPPESPEYLESCLQLPADLNPVVKKLAQKEMGEGSAMMRATHLVAWFQSNFRYGYGYDFANSKDPIGDFLLERPPAHCEVFAATMTLMLRTQRIPARYVNGFVVVEQSWTGDYYVVRVRDAHAWVELWDGNQWHLLDPTPPTALEPPHNWGGWFDSLKEVFEYATRIFTNFSLTGFLEWLGQHWRWPALGVLVLVGLRLRRLAWFPRLNRTPVGPQHGWISELSRTLQPFGYARQDWETLLHWGHRLQEWPQGAPAARWLNDYSAFRYGGQGEEAELGRRWSELIKDLRSQKG